MKSISLHELESKTQSFLEQFFSKDAAQDCTEVIMFAEIHRKEGQGLLKLLGTEPLQNIKPLKPLTIDYKTTISAIINGQHNPSFYVAQTATRICLEKAKTNGFGIVGANGIYSSTGALGFYAEKIAKAGLIAFCCARSPGSTAPFGLNIPLFGTNPFAWAFPTQQEPIVFDMATSAITYYELVLAKMRGEALPQNVAIDQMGAPTIDPAAAMNGSILPFDRSYKGSALSMVVELLSGPLVGASFCDYKTFDKDWGFLVLAISPALLVDEKQFKIASSELATIIRSHGAKVPGDNGRNHKAEVFKTKTINIDDQIAALLGIP